MANTTSASEAAAQTPPSTEKHTAAEQFFIELAAEADIRINGDRPWDIRVYDPSFLSRALSSGAPLAFAEAYMQGHWDCDRIDEMMTRVLHAHLERRLKKFGTLQLLKAYLSAAVINKQDPNRAFKVGEVHYDIGNDLYRRMLDSRMIYSCAFWADADNLEEAQYQKLDMICRKLELKPGMTLLDIGCGWGGLAEFAARHYGAKVTGITISKEQQRLAQEHCAGLPVEIRLVDYRALEGQFDRIVSVGMFEHVGHKNYRTYFDTVSRLLADDGLFLLHTIGTDRQQNGVDPFIEKYIFPNGEIPCRKLINDTSLGLLRLEDWHNFGPDYDRTLMAWWHNFDAAWPELKDKYDQGHFYRMWKYYLLSCAAYFRSREGQLWQIVYSKPDSMREYRSLR
ncbi:cyclopropane-fatty-acyl-phospholipid synthase [Marinimicrobium koreense]|jgi:cyclopropane-fatty-acyl-phospholipid synthase|uniref:Cyclopropane-fatty-acyl-phospholipid synthase n=1 Tax=Marinimicrobium koreense TaxID=306545 RepID=A0A3N1P180_9GAMM|nr:cyclopropane fatty acyl phospholipid synthase [Marinimicrobium koreense]ROQ21331.1 cyclopropane-fatty-acyl-phospholipid synthase [Marinimicrobium koreense]